jgi:WD40 repeat protein/DNA-binding SARP family transcriptional activator
MLGPLQAVGRGERIGLGGPRQRTVLALLLVNANTVVSTERLIDGLYGEEPPDAARKSLQSYVANLRRALNSERELLRGQSPGYVLEADTAEVDALVFERLVHQAEAILEKDPAAARNRLTKGLALWYGSPLVDVADEAMQLRREVSRLEELRLAAIVNRIEADLALGLHETLVAELRTLTADNPFRERLWGQLMLALYRSGRQADALRTFQHARRVLGEELGLEPSPDLYRLEDQILTQDPALAAERAVVPLDLPEITGTTIHGYEVRELVGEGRLGTTYRAFHPAMGREVALKIIDARLAQTAEFIRGFETSAGSVASLEHPHVVPIYDYWREPAGAYVVTRWMGGGSLNDVPANAPISVDTAREMIDQVGSALGAAHRQGIVHGALKSTNILFDVEGHAYLSDFRIRPNGEPAGSPRADVVALAAAVASALGTPQDEAGADLAGLLAAIASNKNSAGPADGEAFLTYVLSAGRPSELRQPLAVSNPYKGLRAFGEPDALDFFGRESLIERLLQRLRATGPEGRFIAVVGPSGSGKSSAVRAGLLPRLRAGDIAGSGKWFITEMLPGVDPLEELEAALLRIAADPPVSLLEELASDPEGLQRSVDIVLPDPETELLLIIDQLEELFTLVDDEDARRTFIERLVTALEDPAGRLRIVTTLRADFFDRPLRYPGLGELISRYTETILPLRPAEIERAVAGPSNRVGVTVEPELEAQIVADVTDRPGSLPLLQYALTELFETRSADSLTLDAYRSIGGVGAALGRRAEETYGSLDPSDQAASRQVFLRLVALDEGSGDTRRRALRSELTALEGIRRAAERTLDAFGAHRLLTFDRDPITRSPTVEVAHEALLREWPRLRRWVDEARGDLVQEHRLAAATSEWVNAGRDASYLLAGSRLTEMETWATRADLSLTKGERDFLAESVAARRTREAEEQRRTDQERALERRSRRRLRALVAVLGVAAAAGGALTVIANRQADRAEHNLAVATARELTAEATRLTDGDAELGLLLAVAAADTAIAAGENVLPETIEALHQAVLASRLAGSFAGGPGAFSPDGDRFVTSDGGTGLAFSPPQGVARVYSTSGEELMALRGHGGRVYYANYSPDGSLIVTTSLDGTARLWNASTGTQIHLLNHGGQPVFAAAFNADGSLLATTEEQSAVRLWDTVDGTLLDTLHQDGPPLAVSFSNTGRLAVATDTPHVYVWDLSTGEVVMQLTGHRSAVCNVKYTPDGSLLATASQDGRVLLWDAVAGTPQLEIVSEPGPICGLDIDATGTLLTAAGESGTARVWEIPSGREVTALAGHASGVAWVTFDPSGRFIATSGGDGLTKLWDVSPTGSRELLTLPTPGPATVAVYGPNGSRLVTGTEQGSIAIWDIRAATELWSSAVHANRISGAAFSPDGSLVVTVSEDSTARLWDVAGGELLQTFASHSDTVWSAAFSPAGTELLTAGLDGTARAWDVATGRELATAFPSMPAVFGIDYSPDGSRIALAGVGIELWDAGLGAKVYAFGGHEGAILDIEFSPDGSRVASAGADGTVRLWDVASLESGEPVELARLEGHAGAVMDVEFALDGTAIATSGLDGAVKLWSADGDETFSLAGLGPGIFSFDPTAAHLALPAADGTVRVVVLGVDELLDLARSRLTRDLTDEECSRYLHVEACPPTIP